MSAKKKKILCQKWRPYKAEGPLSKSICVKEKRNGLPVSTKATLRHSHVVCTLWHHTTSPCPTPICFRRTYLPRRLPEVTSKTSMVQTCAGSTSMVKLECSLGFLGHYAFGPHQQETVQIITIIILCSNHLEYKKYAFVLEKGEFPSKVTGLLCGRRVCQFVSTPFFSCKDH